LSLNPHTWLPTTTKQSVLVYALNVLLLFNLTVIVVMLAGTPETPSERAKALPRPASDAVNRPAVLLPQPGSPEETVAASPATELIPQLEPQPQLSAEPFVLASPPAEQNTTSASPQPQPTQDDPPVTFFGVGLD
jgi:hypothetical protein